MQIEATPDSHIGRQQHPARMWLRFWVILTKLLLSVSSGLLLGIWTRNEIPELGCTQPVMGNHSYNMNNKYAHIHSDFYHFEQISTSRLDCVWKLVVSGNLEQIVFPQIVASTLISATSQLVSRFVIYALLHNSAFFFLFGEKGEATVINVYTQKHWRT